PEIATDARDDVGGISEIGGGDEPLADRLDARRVGHASISSRPRHTRQTTPAAAIAAAAPPIIHARGYTSSARGSCRARSRATGTPTNAACVRIDGTTLPVCDRSHARRSPSISVDAIARGLGC